MPTMVMAIIHSNRSTYKIINFKCIDVENFINIYLFTIEFEVIVETTTLSIVIIVVLI
jgi:hypothetical protein